MVQKHTSNLFIALRITAVVLLIGTIVECKKNTNTKSTHASAYDGATDTNTDNDIGIQEEAGATENGSSKVNKNTGPNSNNNNSNNGDTHIDITGGSDEKLWRPFSDDSPWNTIIPENPELESDSADLISDLKASSPYGEHLDINIPRWSIPLYWADENTPKVEVRCRIGGMGFSGDDGMNAVAMVPIPEGAMPDPESDHHMLIVDLSTNLEWGMWDTVINSGQWTCGLGANIDLSDSGVRPPANDNPTWYTSHGARACGYPLIAGLIRVDEIKAGRIDHALVIAYPHIRAGLYTSPASTAQARIGNDAIKQRGIPCGGHIQFDPGIDLDTLELTRSGKIIMRALQQYGAYVGDFSGSINLYAENSPEAQEYWNSGVLSTSELRSKLDLDWFRVLKIGSLYDNGNGD